MADGQPLDDLYEKVNLRRLLDYLGHSLRVSDVIVVNKNKQEQVYYVDSFGFKEVPEFFQVKAEEKIADKLSDQPAARDVVDAQRTFVLSRLQEKKDEAAKISKQKQKPEKSKGLDRN